MALNDLVMARPFGVNRVFRWSRENDRPLRWIREKDRLTPSDACWRHDFRQSLDTAFSVDEFYVNRPGNQTVVPGSAQECPQGLPASRPVIDRPVIDIHPDEQVGLRGIQVSCVAQSVVKGLGAMVQGIPNALL